MSPAKAAVQRRLAELGFHVCFIVSLSLVLLCQAVVEGWHSDRAQPANVFLLSRQHWIPHGDTMAAMRVGFPLDEVEHLRRRIAEYAEAGIVGMEPTTGEIDGQRIAIDRVVTDAVGAHLLFGDTVSCEPGLLRADPGLASRYGKRPRLSIDGRPTQLTYVDLRVLRHLLPVRPAMVVVECRASPPASVRALLVPWKSDMAPKLQALAADRSWYRRELFAAELIVDQLSAVQEAAFNSKLGWATGLRNATAVMTVLLFAAWGLLIGLRGGREHVQRRVLGASLPMLASRLAYRVLFAVVFGLSLAYLAGAALGKWAGASATPTATTLLALWPLWLALALAAWVPAAAMSLQSLDRRLYTSVTGDRCSAPLAPYLALWTFGLSLALLFATLGGAACWGLWRDLSLQLGYQPRGLVSVSFRLEPEASTASAGAGRWPLQRQILQAAQELGYSKSTLLCPAPWEFSSHADILGDDHHVGLLLGAGPNFLATLQVLNVSGRDFTTADMTQSGSRIEQGDDLTLQQMSAMGGERIARIHGLLLGAASPQLRHFSASPISQIECDDFSLLLRGGAPHDQALAQLTESLRKRFPSLAVSPAQEVNESIWRARLPAIQLATLLGLTALLAAALQLVFASALAVAFFESNRRELAIRLALGLSPAAATRALLSRLARWSAPAIALTSLTVGLLDSHLVHLGLLVSHPTLVESAGWSLFWLALGGLTTAAWLTHRMRDFKLHDSLAADG